MFRHQRIGLAASLALILFSSCSDQVAENRRGGRSLVSIGVDNIWDEDSFSLQSTVSNFEILVECDGSYRQIVTTTNSTYPFATPIVSPSFCPSHAVTSSSIDPKWEVTSRPGKKPIAPSLVVPKESGARANRI